MRRTLTIIAAAVLFASLIGFTIATASAADNRWEIDIAPAYFLNGTGDANAAPPPGYIPIYNNPNPQITNNWRVDYGVTYHMNKKWTLAYTHSNLDFSIGRVLSLGNYAYGKCSPATFTCLSLISGDIDDRTDQGTLTYAAGHGLSVDGYYSSHERTNVQALCLNQMNCPGPTGTELSNPSSINSNDWGVGVAYEFGPHTMFEPPMFKATFDVDYYPRPNNPVPCPGSAGNPGVTVGGVTTYTPGYQPACNSGGINGYVGSQTVYPYGLTMFPFADTHMVPGFIPFIGYSSAPVIFHAENTPEVYNITVFGLVKVLPHGLTLSYTYLKLQGRYSADTVPPPDVIRFAVSELKLNYALHF
ncbi:MAG TPA: hypothetical protein VMF11_06490 [Candidatus Baltobacteraceae bacterium]|nr:hypothetical protein [Candidatus Baltobacteraceae bacterium]